MADKILKHWTSSDEIYVRNNFQKKTVDDIAKELGKSRMAVQLFIHRKRITAGGKIKRNIVQEILKLKFTHIEDFQPNRNFYNETKIGQRRWWQLYFGEKQILQNEYLSLTRYFGITLQEAFEARQLNLFEEENND